MSEDGAKKNPFVVWVAIRSGVAIIWCWQNPRVLDMCGIQHRSPKVCRKTDPELLVSVLFHPDCCHHIRCVLNNPNKEICL